MNKTRSLCILLSMQIMVFCTIPVGAQTTNGGRWYGGTGTATAKDMEEIQTEALNRARANALQKAGVGVNSGTLSLKSEENNRLIDFFSEFAESNAQGLILDERDVHFDRPVPVDSTYTLYRMTVHLQALVPSPRGRTDPAFEVTLASPRDIYKEYEPVTLKIKSTESGYLTILDIHGDSINVLLPNVIDQNNFLSANTDFAFPPGKAYSLEFETEKGKSSSSDLLIAIVTKDAIPFPNVSRIGFVGSRLMLGEKTLATYARWLYKIPLDRRSASQVAIKVEKQTTR